MVSARGKVRTHSNQRSCWMIKELDKETCMTNMNSALRHSITSSIVKGLGFTSLPSLEHFSFWFLRGGKTNAWTSSSEFFTLANEKFASLVQFPFAGDTCNSRKTFSGDFLESSMLAANFRVFERPRSYSLPFAWLIPRSDMLQYTLSRESIQYYKYAWLGQLDGVASDTAYD